MPRRKKINLHKTALIRGRNYSIRLLEDLEEFSEVYGRCNTTLHAIEIERSVWNGQNTADTIVHELLHAMVHESGLRAVKKWDEETVVSLLSPVLTCFLADNPDLVRNIVKIHKQGKEEVYDRPAT